MKRIGIQGSNKPSSCLQVSQPENYVKNGQLILKHSKEDKEMRLRAYIKTLLPVLKCHMDVQMSDGEAALLQYASSYTSKLTQTMDILRNTNEPLQPISCESDTSQWEIFGHKTFITTTVNIHHHHCQ